MKMKKEKDYPNKPSWSRGRRIDFRFNSLRASQVAQMVKSLPANAGDTRDVGSIPGSGRSLEKEMATHSSILAWETPWTEELGGAIVHGISKSQTQLSTHIHLQIYLPHKPQDPHFMEKKIQYVSSHSFPQILPLS